MANRNWRRTAEKTAGWLICTSALAAIATLYILIFLASQMDVVTESDLAFWSLPRMARRIGYLAILLFMGYLGLVLLEGRQTCVLYLRKFGLNVTVISPAHAGGLGRHVRLFTLHDGAFTPSEIPRLDKWLSRIGPIAVLTVIVIATKLLTDVMLRGYSEGNAANWFAMVFFMAFAAASLWILFAMLLLIRFKLRLGATIHVRTPADIDKAAAAVRWAAHWLCRPAIVSRQATVIAVAPELWQTAVIALLHQSNAIVVDVSEQSANVDWELNTLDKESITPTLIAAESNQPLQAGSRNVALTYTLSDPSRLKAFRQALYAMLTQSARRILHMPVPRPAYLRYLAGEAFFLAMAFVVAASSAWIVNKIAFMPALLLLVGNDS